MILKRFFYIFFWIICKIGLYCFFNRVEVNGRKHLPKNSALIFTPNHQNAFLDAIIIAVLSNKPVAFFTRADVFKQPFLWCLSALNMLPIYRAKDGFTKVIENDGTLQRSIQMLQKGKSLMVFPEANHGYDYYLRPLSKGVARLAFAAQLEHPCPIYIVPVGLNFFKHHHPRHKLIVNYGKPIDMRDHISLYQEHRGKALSEMRDKMTLEIKKLIIIPDQDDLYDRRKQVLQRTSESISFSKVKKKAESLDFEKDKSYPILKHFTSFLSIFNFPIYWVSRLILNKINDPVFGGSVKFAIGIFIIPIWYILCFLFFTLFLSISNALLFTTLLLTLLFAKEEITRFV